MIHTLLMFLVLCGGARYLPDAQMTPGMANPLLTQAVLCAPGFHTGKWRHVTAAIKRQVYREYGIPRADWHLTEIDHLLCLECGGSNDIGNLWAEPWHVNVDGFDLGAHTKDAVENAARRALLAGTMPLADIQAGFRTNWVDLGRRLGVTYPKYKGAE